MSDIKGNSCRICLHEGVGQEQDLDKVKIEDSSALDIINYFSQLKLDFDQLVAAGLPHKICIHCTDALNSSMQFWYTAWSSQKEIEDYQEKARLEVAKIFEDLSSSSSDDENSDDSGQTENMEVTHEPLMDVVEEQRASDEGALPVSMPAQEARNYTCGICTKTFKTTSNVKRHVSKVHQGGSYTYNGKTFQISLTKNVLEPSDHRKKRSCTQQNSRDKVTMPDTPSSQEGRNYRCSVCTKTFKTDWCVKQHVTNVHQGGSYTHKGKTIEVSIAKVDPKPSDLRKTKTNSNKSSNSLNNLNKVQRQSTDHPHTCKLCEKRFLQPFRLRVHMIQAHNAVSNYKCIPCNKYFVGRPKIESHFMSARHKRRAESAAIDNHQGDPSAI